jgi:hypothetical protein
MQAPHKKHVLTRRLSVQAPLKKALALHLHASRARAGV